MYLREMGSVELLSREGEIAIAKRIEAGRELMIGALVRKPADLRGAHRVARRTQRRQGPAARHHRPGSHVWRRSRWPARQCSAARRSRRQAAESPAQPDAAVAAAACRDPRSRCRRRAPPKPAPAPRPSRRRRRRRRRSRRRRRLPGRRRFRRRRQSAAFGDGSRAQAAGAGDARRHRRASTRSSASCRTPRSKPRWPADELSTGQERRFKKLRNETMDLVKSLKLNNNRIEALVDQMYGINKPPGRPGRPAAAPGRKPWRRPRAISSSSISATSSTPTGRAASAASAGMGWQDFVTDERDKIKALRDDIQSLAAGNPPVGRRIPPQRPDGAEGRARIRRRQEGNDRGQPAPRDLHRQEIHQPRPAVPGPDPGRQYRPDEGGR